MNPRLIGDHPRFAEVSQSLRRVTETLGPAADDLTVYLDSLGMLDSNLATAFLWRRGDTVDRAPSLVSWLMSNTDSPYVIWLSKSLLDSSASHIMWVYAHELRHYMQRRQLVEIGSVQCFLSMLHETEGIPERRTQLEEPADLDSELFARRALKAILGEHGVSSHIATECEKSGDAAPYYQRLAYLEQRIANHIAI